MRKAQIIAPVLGLLLVAGCADLQDQVEDVVSDIGNDDNDGPRTVAYECDDQRDFTARFSGDRDEVRIDVGGRSYDLEHSERDDGMRIYTNRDDVELRVDEDQAYVRIPGESDLQDCERA
jgi:hypothetical protein